jgi:hypothetical protein
MTPPHPNPHHAQPPHTAPAPITLRFIITQGDQVIRSEPRRVTPTLLANLLQAVTHIDPSSTTPPLTLPQTPPTQSLDTPQLRHEHETKLLELLAALRPSPRQRKAQPLEVFLLYFQHNLGPDAIAAQLNCDRSLIFKRLQAIRKRLSWKPRRIRYLGADPPSSITHPKALDRYLDAVEDDDSIDDSTSAE